MVIFKKGAVSKYLSSLYGEEIKVLSLREFRGDEVGKELKGFGYGQSVLVEFTRKGRKKRVVLQTVKPSPFGHEYPSDRACSLLLAHHDFNQLPSHVHSLDVGTLSKKGNLVSLDGPGEFFLLTKYVQGHLYYHDLRKIGSVGKLTKTDKRRVMALADYLAKIHAKKRQSPELYRRRLRDLIGHGEGIMGQTDNYPSDFNLIIQDFLKEVERQGVAWRWKIKDKTHRLSQVHGDFHPFNVLFHGNAFTLLDRSRGEWGEPADDVTAMTINYIFFSLQRYGRLAGPFEELFNLFWQHYLKKTNDEEILKVVQPFYVWRALVLASPIWYPNLDSGVRVKLFKFINNVLSSEVFDLEKVNAYFRANN